MTLALYLSRRYLRSFALVLAVFAALLGLIEMVERIRRHADDGLGLGGAAQLALMSLPENLYAILPLIGNLAAIMLFLGLARSSEMVAIRASGRSALRCLLAPAITAALVGVLAVATLNPIVAGTKARLSQIEAGFGGAGQTVSVSEGAVWLRQAEITEAGDETGGQVVIRARRAAPDGTTLYAPSLLVFAPGAGPRLRIEAAEARLESGAWVLSDVKSWPLDAANPEGEATRVPVLHVPTALTPASIRDGVGAPSSVPIWKLPGYIAQLEDAGFGATRHSVWLWVELALPLAMAAMVALAAVFTMRHLRGRSAGTLALAAFGAGLGLFFLRNLTQVLGDAGGVPPVLAGLAPPIIALFLALGALLGSEDG